MSAAAAEARLPQERLEQIAVQTWLVSVVAAIEADTQTQQFL
jgi:hypothetical protein